jgi:hypothetical protein
LAWFTALWRVWDIRVEVAALDASLDGLRGWLGRVDPGRPFPVAVLVADLPARTGMARRQWNFHDPGHVSCPLAYELIRYTPALFT